MLGKISASITLATNVPIIAVRRSDLWPLLIAALPSRSHSARTEVRTFCEEYIPRPRLVKRCTSLTAGSSSSRDAQAAIIGTSAMASGCGTPRRSRRGRPRGGRGSNGSRVRLWKLEPQRLADETGLSIRICHFPPGTSKWNKIEQRLFSFISMNWRGQPLISHEVMINLIANTRTRSRLQVHAKLDGAPYPKGLKVSAAQFDAINLARDTFHGDWNYTI